LGGYEGKDITIVEVIRAFFDKVPSLLFLWSRLI